MSTGSTDTPQKKTAAHGFKEGDLIGESYRILSFIGEGAMGEVYRAKHEMMPREYALKVLNTNQITENSWRRFQIEAQAIARMNHPNVVVIYNLGVHAGRLPFYVMDLLSGESLFDRLNRVEQLSVAEALPLFIQVCEGLGYAHKKGIVHRDIKPHNIVVLNEQEASGALVKIVDFGIAKLAETKDLQNQQLTKMGEVFGTPYYMSPEQSMGQRVDGRSDIYSLGCTLFEALVSTPPFRGKSSTETMLLHQTAAPPTLAKASGGQTFPESVEFIVAKMLAKEPMERYQSMEAVKHDLELALQGKDLSVLPYMATSQRQNYDTTGGTTSNSATAGRTTSSSSATGRTTARQTQPKLTPQEDSGQYTIPPASSGLGFKLGIAAMAVVLLAGATGAYFLLKPKDIGATDSIKTVQKVNVAAKPDAAEKKEIASTEPDLSNSVGLIEVIPGVDLADPEGKLASSSDRAMYSRRFKQGGVEKIEFNFPADVSLGTKTAHRMTDDTLYDWSLAKGKVVMDWNSKRYFQPTAFTAKNIQYLKRFRSGDLYGLFFWTPGTQAHTIDRGHLVPGISGLSIAKYKGEDEPACKALIKYRGLKALNLNEANVDGKNLGVPSLLESLHSFRFNGGRNFQVPLKLLASYQKLTELSLLECDLSRQDLLEIGSLNSLKILRISRPSSAFKRDELNLLSDLHKLEELSFGASKLPTDADSIIVNLPSLQVLLLDYSKNAGLLPKINSRRPNLKIVNTQNSESEFQRAQDAEKLQARFINGNLGN
ncbi:MAG TPA: serine/threonine-protein kinase [Candidatus Obscuribacter sp.]|nr:serine/threonine-protein kinase [Candidatus Obscuribacter sp.]